MHARQQIREAVEALLTPEFSRALTNQSVTIPDDWLPCVAIYGRNEQKKYVTTRRSIGSDSVKVIERELELRLELRDKALENVEDKLEAMAVKIERVIADSGDLDGLVESIVPVADDTPVDGNGQAVIGCLIMDYRVKYRTPDGDPETII